MYDVAAVLTSIQSLLSDPNPDSPANPQAAKMFVNNRVEYDRLVLVSLPPQYCCCCSYHEVVAVRAFGRSPNAVSVANASCLSMPVL